MSRSGFKVHELLMCGVREIDFEAGLVLEGHEKAVGEAVIQALGADVCPPLKALNSVDFSGQFDEGLLDALNLVGGGAVFEFEEDNVAVGSVGGWGGGGHQGENGE